MALPLALSLLSQSGCGPKSDPNAAAFAMGPVAVRAVRATSGDVPLEVSAVGTVESLSTVEIKPRVTGTIVKVNFQEGQQVQAGDVLFEIDQQPFLDAIAEAEANLARDTALEAQSRANVAKDQALLKNSRSQADRALQLQKEGIFSREQTDTAVSSAESYEAALQADRAAVDSAQASIRADKARLQQARLQLGYTTVRAPISGRAGAIALKAGNVARENDSTLVTLLQVAPTYVTFTVPEPRLNEIRRFQAQRALQVEVVFDDKTALSGPLQFIDNTVDATTGTIKLKALFDNKAHQLWPGQFVNVRLRLTQEPDRILVPTQTVQSGPEGKYVWVVGGDGAASLRSVQVLRTWEGKSVIGSGLKDGEMVVTEGQIRLAPGAKVKLLNAQASAGQQPAGSGQ